MSQADFVVKTGIVKSSSLPDGGKFEASCGFEITLDITTLHDPDRLSRTIKEAYKHCLDSVNGQIHAATNKPQAPPVPSTEPLKPPVAPVGTFGGWMKERLVEFPMPTETFIKSIYGHVYKEVSPELWTDAGNRLNTDWQADPAGFKARLDQAVLSIVPA